MMMFDSGHNEFVKHDVQSRIVNSILSDPLSSFMYRRAAISAVVMNICTGARGGATGGGGGGGSN